VNTPRSKLHKFGLMMLFGLMAAMFATPAGAHTGDQSYLYLEITEEVTAEVHLPFADLAEHTGINIGGSDAEIEAAIAANAEGLEQYARDHFSISSDGEPWALSDDVEVRRLEENEYVVVVFEVDKAGSDVPALIDVELDPFFDEDPDRDALFLIFNDWERGFVDNEADPLARFTAGDRAQTVDLGDRSWQRNLGSSIGLGLDHIKTGPDHVLFVAVLLLPSVLAFTTRWEPADKFGKSLWRVLKIVSMFTVAHSITFTLAGLNFIPLPGPRLVETIIAVSIAAAALHNLYPIFPQKEWLIAFGFGLFHGLGFASLVEDLQVSRSTQLVSLIGRNIGIEIGQALVVIIVFPMLFLLRRTRFYMPLFKIASWALIIISIGWVGERLFSTAEFTSWVVDRVFAWPRILWIVIALTAVSAAIWQREDKADKLLPTVST